MFYPTVNSGGVKRYILDKQHYCEQHTNHVHCRIIPDVLNAKVENGPRDIIYKIKSPALPWNPSYRLMYSYKQIKQALEDFKPDVIEIGCPYITPWIVRKIYKNAQNRPKLVGFYHADFPRADVYQAFNNISVPLAKFAQRFAERVAHLVYTKMDQNIVTGPRLKQRLTNLGIGNVNVLPFGVDTEKFKPSDDEPTNLDGPLKLLFVGRLSKEKRILPCIDRIHKLVREYGVKLE
jgi:alpha-1,6-mannosyltransferase